MPRLTIPSLLEGRLAVRPESPAFIEGERTLSCAQFDAVVRNTAAWLAAQGLGPGDRVAVWLVNRIEWLALLFGLARIGAALVAVNTRYRAAELETILQRSRARMLVLQLNFRNIDFPAVLDGVDPERIVALERVAVVDAAGSPPRAVLGRPAVAFDALVPHGDAGPDRSTPGATAALFSTSGTTRGPKLVIHSQKTIALHSLRVASVFGFAGQGACLLAALPFCGVFGLNSALAAFAGGAPIVMLDTFDGAGAAALVKRHAVTHMFGSDEAYRRMAEAAPGPVPFPSVRLFGFAAFQPGAAEFARSACEKGIPLVGLYGSSEVQALFSLQPLQAPIGERIECGGRPVSGPDAEIRIRDPESGELAPTGSSGEIEIRAPTNFVGYLDNPEATAAAHSPDGFFRTGDIGRLRGDGTFVYETRSGDAMRLGGFLVNPAEIEDTLKRVPGIADVAVIAMEISGAPRCVAFAVRSAESGPQEAELIAAARERMAGFKAPARVWFVAEIPTTQSANGTKVQRAKLREMALQRLASPPQSTAPGSKP